MYYKMQCTIRYKGRTFEEGKKINFIDEIKGALYVLVNAFRHS